MKSKSGRKAAVMLLALLLLLPALGCQDARRRNGGSVTGTGTEGHPIAVVNNERITLEEFLDDYQLFLTRRDRFIQNDKGKKQEIKEILLANLVDRKLLDQEGRRKGVEVDEAVVEAEIRRLLAPWDPANLENEEKARGRDFDEWRLEFWRRMVHQKLIQQEVIAKIRISRREMRAYYERHREEFVQPEQVRVRHIAVGSRSAYNRVVRRLKRNRDFIKLVKEYSITPDRLADGDLGYMPRGVLPAEFDQAIFKMSAIGSISPTGNPVKTQMGYHIFKLEGRKPRMELDFKAAMPRIESILLERKQPQAFKEWLQKLRDKANIKIDQRLLKAEMG